MKSLRISTAGLGKIERRFSFALASDFLQSCSEREDVPMGAFAATVNLTGHGGFIESMFSIRGSLHLTCDRSLREFEYPIAMQKKIIFKYADITRELDDEVMLIDRRETDLEVAPLLYELIMLAIPMKKLHPDYAAQDLGDGLVYSTSSDSEQGPEETDPVWKKQLSSHLKRSTHATS